ncbi:serine/threonine protein kinase [Streptomyces spiroverticillatus]|uniref:Serine/threonine protein kinase n=1 Tax=Streptomyces finlayi TaxID=67296 RepID=A0A919CDJ6_9ACTN|nr:serine/threonine-protein kinase [Streptomyces finlayi]GHA34782.1 serine/threonine protein kinase [Streptomyces spiroverticillatus]GHD12252.1 serine/threonine protein kinase [Streptomyces finlayi]
MTLAADDPQVIGEYRLLGRLGTGGMGTVFLGRSPSGREVAVKVIHEQFSADPDFRVRFKQEIAAARQVSGAFTASVVDADAEAVRPWMATQYVPGPTLAQLLEEQGPLGDAELRLLGLGLVEALRDIHRVGVVHRDLKPANVLMAADGPRVIDFGVSRAVGNAPLTVTGNVMGTPPFMSPEQLNSPRSVGPASDVFSLATLLVYAAVGHGPFDSDSPFMTAYAVVHEPPVLDGVREPLRGILAYCLVKEPDERPDLQELTGLLRKWRPGRTGADGADGAAQAKDAAAPDPDPDTMVVRRRNDPLSPATRPRRPWAVALAALLLVAGAGGLVLLLPESEDGTAVPPAPRPGQQQPLRSGEALPAGWRSWQAVLPPATVGATGPVESVRCTADGTVAVHCGGGSVRTVRLDAATGTVLWRAPQPPTAPGTREIGDSSTSRLAGGKAVFVVETLSDTAHRLVALDSRDGRRLWHRPVGKADREPAVLGALVVAPSADLRAVVARDTATGDTRWTSPNPAGLECVPYEMDGVLYGVCTDPDEEGGTRTYVRYASGDGGRTVVTRRGRDHDQLGVSGGWLVFAQWGRAGDVAEHEHHEGSYSALVLVDPKGVRAPRTVRLSGTPQGRPVLRGDTVFFVHHWGTVSAYDLRGSGARWTRNTGVRGLGAPETDARGTTLYVPSLSGRVVALDSRTGEERWRSGHRGAPPAAYHDTSVLRVGGALVVTGAGGAVFSMDPHDPGLRPGGDEPPGSGGFPDGPPPPPPPSPRGR